MTEIIDRALATLSGTMREKEQAYIRARDAALVEAEDYCRRTKERAEDFLKTRLREVKSLEKRVEECLRVYADTGVFFVPPKLFENFDWLPVQAGGDQTPQEAVFRSAQYFAEQMGRRLIYAQHRSARVKDSGNYSYAELRNYIWLICPNDNRMHNITAALTLVATADRPIEESEPLYGRRRNNRVFHSREGIYSVGNTRTAMFEFHGEKAEDFFFEWRRKCATDALFKYMLRA